MYTYFLHVVGYSMFSEIQIYQDMVYYGELTSLATPKICHVVHVTHNICPFCDFKTSPPPMTFYMVIGSPKVNVKKTVCELKINTCKFGCPCLDFDTLKMIVPGTWTTMVLHRSCMLVGKNVYWMLTI